MKKNISRFFLLLGIIIALTACAADNGSGNSVDEYQSKAIVTITDKTGTEYTINMEVLNKMEILDFETLQGKSGEGETKNTHKGVLLKDAFAEVGINTDEITMVTCSSTDGFSKAYSKEALDDPEKLYLTFEMDGEILKSNDSDVFYIIAKNEQFKQNWTKYLDNMVLE